LKVHLKVQRKYHFLMGLLQLL